MFFVRMFTKIFVGNSSVQVADFLRERSYSITMSMQQPLEQYCRVGQAWVALQV